MTVQGLELHQTGQGTRTPEAAPLSRGRYLELLAELAQFEQQKPTGMPLAPARLASLKLRALEGMRSHGSLSAAAKLAGVARSTIYRWRQKDAAFDAECSEWLHEEMEDELVGSLYQIAMKGPEDPKFANASVRAGEFLLKALNPEVYGDKVKINSTVSINATMTAADGVRDRYRDRQNTRIQQLREADGELVPVLEQGKGNTL